MHHHHQPYRVPVTEADRILAGLSMQVIAVSVGVTREAMTAGDRLGMKACRARRFAMYLSHIGHGWPLERVAHAFAVNRATASSACRWAEDARDDPAIDAWLEAQEAALRTVCEAPEIDLITLSTTTDAGAGARA